MGHRVKHLSPLPVYAAGTSGAAAGCSRVPLRVFIFCLEASCYLAAPLPAPLLLPPHVPLAAVLPKMPLCLPSPHSGPTMPVWQEMPPVLAGQRPLLQEGGQCCAHAKLYCCCWPSVLCPFPKLTPYPSQRLMIFTSERRAISLA